MPSPWGYVMLWIQTDCNVHPNSFCKFKGKNKINSHLFFFIYLCCGLHVELCWVGHIKTKTKTKMPNTIRDDSVKSPLPHQTLPNWSCILFLNPNTTRNQACLLLRQTSIPTQIIISRFPTHTIQFEPQEHDMKSHVE